MKIDGKNIIYTGEIDNDGKACGHGVAYRDNDKGDREFSKEGTFLNGQSYGPSKFFCT